MLKIKLILNIEHISKPIEIESIAVEICMKNSKSFFVFHHIKHINEVLVP